MRKTMAMMAAVAGLALDRPGRAWRRTRAEGLLADGAEYHPVGPGRPGRGAAPGVLPNDTQAQMYNALTPLFNHVTNADLNKRLQVREVRDRGPVPVQRPSRSRTPA